MAIETFKGIGAFDVDMKGDEPTFDEYRTGYISERWGVPDNAAKALQLFELGFTTSGAAKHLPVTESTVKGYHKDLMEKIHENAVFPITQNSKKFDVWGKRDVSDYGTLGYNDGVAHAKEVKENYPVTDRQSQIDPDLREREKPLNRGAPVEEIPKELITIDHNVEVEE